MTDNAINRPLTAKELAPLLGYATHRTVYDLIGRGHIRAVRIGRTVRIPYEEVCRLTGTDPFDW